MKNCATQLHLHLFCIGIILFFAIPAKLSSQNYQAYLRENRNDLYANYSVNISSHARIIGFGALHGSAKTEEAEIILLRDLIQKKGLKYYFMETDFSTARAFQKYVSTGDEILLKQLVTDYGIRVPQEAGIEVFKKWQTLRPLFRDSGIQILGVDQIASYHFAALELRNTITETKHAMEVLPALDSLLADPNTEWQAYYPGKVKSVLQSVLAFCEKQQTVLDREIRDTQQFHFLISNIRSAMQREHRERTMFQNYVQMHAKFSLEKQLQYFRMGVFHILKSRVNQSSPFFARLIENHVYTADEIYSIQGFLTKSQVLWDIQTDRSGKYKGYSTKAGSGIADHWLEHYKGIGNLKKQQLSNLTIFSLRGTNTPYAEPNAMDLVKVQKFPGSAHWTPETGKNTLDYIDCAILIANSTANRPIQELEIPK